MRPTGPALHMNLHVLACVRMTPVCVCMCLHDTFVWGADGLRAASEVRAAFTAPVLARTYPALCKEAARLDLHKHSYLPCTHNFSRDDAHMHTWMMHTHTHATYVYDMRHMCMTCNMCMMCNMYV